MTSGRGLPSGLRRIEWCCLAMVIALSFGSLAHADDWDDEDGADFTANGSYLAIGWNHGNETFGDSIGKTNVSKGFQQIVGSVSSAQGVNVVFGVRTQEFFAVEAQYEFMDGFKFTNSNDEKIEIQTHVLTVNTKIFPFYRLLGGFNEGRLQPNLLAGFGLMTTNDLEIKSSRSIMIRLGGGFDYFINSKWSGFAKSSYIVPYGNLRGTRYFSTSVGVRFHLE